MKYSHRTGGYNAVKRIVLWLGLGLGLTVGMGFILSFIAAGSSAFSQNVLGLAERPPRTSEVVEALDKALWYRLEPGLDYIGVATALGVRLSAYRISPQQFAFSVVQQNVATGEMAASIAKREAAVIAVNGGFFAKAANGTLKPVGLLVDDGAAVSAPWPSDGGFLRLEATGPVIAPTRENILNPPFEAIQSRPVLIEPGKQWALRSNLGNLKSRTLVCLLADNQVLIVLVSGQGLSLFEAGWLLRGENWGGWFDCDSAIALDGGGSTQLYVADHPEMAIDGATPVQNALVVKRKQVLQ